MTAGERRAEEGSPPLPGAGQDAAPDILALPNTDWLAHHLLVSGPAGDAAAFREAAAGAGGIPWRLDLDGLQEDLFLRLLAPAPAEREISVEGARILAATCRDLVGAHHGEVLAAVGRRSRVCPLDLHALVPVPERVLRLGPDSPESLLWLWAHWGTTRALRHVALLPADDQRLRRSARVGYRFFSADWTPWRAIQTLRRRWPSLVLNVRPRYEPDPGRANRAQPKAAGKGRAATRKRAARRGRRARRRP